MSRESAGPAQVVIAGGGVAALETLLALRALAHGLVDATLVSPRDEFVYRPTAVEEPFGGEAQRHALAPIAEELGARFVQAAVAGVDPVGHEVTLDDGRRLGYDALAICVGARTRPAFPGALSFEVGGSSFDVGALLRGLRERSAPHVAFVAPSATTWPLPLYELALMTRGNALRHGPRDLRCSVVTPEHSPLDVFGDEASAALSELLAARGVAVLTRTRVEARADDRLVLLSGGAEPEADLEADVVIAMPLLSGPTLEGLPADEDGFIPVDEWCRVEGCADVWAAGDGTSYRFKQGGLATQQADSVAEQIAARAGAAVEPQPFRPVLRGLLLTGEESMSLMRDAGAPDDPGAASRDYLWWPPHKIGGRYLAPWLAREAPHDELEPPRRPLEVEVALPHHWHGEPLGFG